MDKAYYCAHCGVRLAQYEEGSVEPSCPDHPNGIVEVREDADPIAG